MSITQAAREVQTPATPRLFPLYLTPFEDYMLWDDRRAYPMTFVVQMKFDGAIDRQAITSALPLALSRHPLLRAIVQPAKANKDCWVAAPDQAVEISWGPLDQSLELPEGEFLDLRERAGLRIWIRHDDRSCVITTQFHHAAADGIGAYQFLGDWLWHYADLIGQTIDSPLPEVDFGQLRRRVKASYDIANYRDASGKVNFDYREAYRYAAKNMLSLAKPRRAKVGNHSLPRTTPTDPVENPIIERASDLFPGLCEFEWDKNRYKRLRHVAEKRGQSTNELLIQQLFVALRTWNEHQGQGTDGEFCIMMPMDLREADTRLTTASNLVSYALIRRERHQCVESAELIESLSREMLQFKHTRHRTPFMNTIAWLTRVPRMAKRWFAGRRRLATAIVSNTGDPTKRFTVPLPTEKGLARAGNLTMTDIVGVPPMRYGTRCTISVFTYRRVLKLSLRCDPRSFSVEESQSFLDHYVDTIQKLIAE